MKELGPNDLNEDYTYEERKSIVEAANLLLRFDDFMVFAGKHKPNGRTATTAIIHGKNTFRGQVGDRLLKELPENWRDDLTEGDKKEVGKR
jgi:hypothetical protein